MGDLGVLAKSLITGLWGHFWIHHLRQNVVQCLLLTRKLMSRSRYLRLNVFEALSSTYFFCHFALVPC